MRLNKISLKQAVAMLAATCTLGTCCIAGSVAWAVDSGNTENKVNTANIDDNKKNNTSITLHKYEGPESKTDQSDGTVKSGTNKGDPLYGKKPVRGVVFKVWRVKKKVTSGNPEEIDLSTTAGWEKIKDIENLSNGQAAATTSKEGSSSNSSTTTTYTAEQLMTGTTAKYVKDETNVYTCTSGDDGSCKVGKKEGTGDTVTTTLPMGLYYIEETDTNNAEINTASAGQAATWKKVSITKHVVPFFVTTPLPNPKAKDVAGAWIYDVNVYPKNDISKNRPMKEVEELNRKDFEVGDNGTTITWKISVPLSAPQNGNKTYTQIGFVDKLTNGLAYKEIKDARIVTLDEKGEKAKKNNTEVDDVVLNAVDTNKSPKYYTVDTNTTDVVKFTLKDGTGDDTGLAKALAAYNATVTNNNVSTNAKQTAILVVELVTKFKDNTQARDFKNMANTFVDDNKTGNGEDTTNPCTPGDTRPECDEGNTPTDDAHFGTLTVNKYVTQKATKTTGSKTENITLPLNGAKFDLYEITSKVSNSKNVKVENNDVTKKTTFNQPNTANNSPITQITTTADTPVTFNVKKVTYRKANEQTDTPVTLETKEKTEGTKKVEGTASVSLFVKDKSSSDTKLYCVVETEAPKGYLLDSRPHCIPLSANTTTTQDGNVTINIPAGNTLPVENKKATGMDQILAALPMTGARGLVILTLCGIVGLAGTFFYIVLKRRKEQEQA